MSAATKKVFIEPVAEQQENIKNQRKTLKVLQGVATDKENLTGRPKLDKLSRLKASVIETTSLSMNSDHANRKKMENKTAETQTSPDAKSNNNKKQLKTAASETTSLSTNNDYAKRKKIESKSDEPQTSTNVKQITEEDLCSEAKPGEFYYERLAEKRRETLEQALQENQRLYERIDGLEEELNTSRQQLEEAQHLVAVLTEILNENEAEEENREIDAEEENREIDAEEGLASIDVPSEEVSVDNPEDSDDSTSSTPKAKH